MSTTHTLSGNVRDFAGGAAFTSTSTDTIRGYVEAWTNRAGGATTGTSGGQENQTRLGTYPIEFATDGTWSVTGLPATGEGKGWNPAVQAFRVVLTFADPGTGRHDAGWTSEYFELTADTDMKDVEVAVTQAIVSAASSAAAASASASAAAASAAAAQEAAALAEDISGISTSDSLVAALLADPGSDTRAAYDELVNDVMPNGIIEGRTLFQYGPSRGVGVTAQRIHYNRLRRRLGCGFYFNASVGGHQAADTASLAYGAISTTRQAGGENEWAPSAGVSTWANKAMQGGILLWWPFGNDAMHDGKPDRNSTTAKARASAQNALHALVALARAETRIESSLVGTGYTTTNGSPTITAQAASPWYRGMAVSGAGIPANSYVGEMINGGFGGFKLSSSRTSQVDVNATASATGVALTFAAVYTGTWAPVNSNTAFSGSSMVKTNADAATSTYVLHLPEARRVHWVTAAIDDAEYAGTKGAPYGGTGGAGYSITIDGGSAITGTTSDQHRYGQLDLCHSQMAVDLGTLDAGVHTIVITSVGASKLLVDEGLLVDSLTPITVLLMKEVELPDAYYALVPSYGASYAKTQIYNGFIDSEIAKWPADESVITADITDYGYDKDVHISGADGAWAHFNDAGERLAANAILSRLNELSARVGLVWA